MPVAVHLVEALALITLLGILSGVSIFIIVAQRASLLLLYLVTPLSYLISGILNVAENILVKTLAGLLSVTCSLGNML